MVTTPTFLLHAHILSHSMVTTDLDDPWEAMNCFSPATVMPLRSTPLTVGKRGSSLQRSGREVRREGGRGKGQVYKSAHITLKMDKPVSSYTIKAQPTIQSLCHCRQTTSACASTAPCSASSDDCTHICMAFSTLEGLQLMLAFKPPGGK